MRPNVCMTEAKPLKAYIQMFRLIKKAGHEKKESMWCLNAYAAARPLLIYFVSIVNGREMENADILTQATPSVSDY